MIKGYCAECEHLTIINKKRLYAKCKKTGLKFKPFERDTRTHTCKKFKQIQITPLKFSRKKKDYRPFCLLFYTASPSETVLNMYKAGCNINKHDKPCKYCRKCKYGIEQKIIIDEVHEIDGGIKFKAHIENCTSKKEE